MDSDGQKEYVRKKVKILAKQKERIDKRNENSKVDKKLEKLFDKFVNNKIDEITFSELATDLLFAEIATYLFDELYLREKEFLEEQEAFESMTMDEIESMPPVNLTKYTQEYIEKTGLFGE